MTEIHEEYLRDILVRLIEIGVIRKDQVESIIQDFDCRSWRVYKPYSKRDV